MKAGLRFGVIGSPIGHSRSPRMHAAAFAALGLRHTYEAIDTPPEELVTRLAELRAGKWAGLNVTIPHKTAVIPLLDDLAQSAKTMGAVNTLVRLPDGQIVGHNTDAPALRRELDDAGDRAGLGAPQGDGGLETLTFRGRSAVVLGSGGAARAALAALASLGADPIVVRARDAARAASLSGLVSSARVELQPLAAPAAERADLAAVVQTTSCGMEGGPPGDLVEAAVAWPTVPRDVVVLDVVYAPARTPLLARAESLGLVAVSGLGMLARQGALAQELWLGVVPPYDVMRAALS